MTACVLDKNSLLAIHAKQSFYLKAPMLLEGMSASALRMLCKLAQSHESVLYTQKCDVTVMQALLSVTWVKRIKLIR